MLQYRQISLIVLAFVASSGHAAVSESTPTVCGIDGWGYAQGEIMFTTDLGNMTSVTGVYLFGGQQLVVVKYLSGPGETLKGASANFTCRTR